MEFLASILLLFIVTVVYITAKQNESKTNCNTCDKTCKINCLCKSCTNKKLCGFPDRKCQMYSKED